MELIEPPDYPGFKRNSKNGLFSGLLLKLDWNEFPPPKPPSFQLPANNPQAILFTIPV